MMHEYQYKVYFKGAQKDVVANDAAEAANVAFPPPRGWYWHRVGKYSPEISEQEEIGQNSVMTVTPHDRGAQVRFVLYDFG